MKVTINTEALKFAGGAIVVGAAALIMLPDVMRYVAGLWRLGLLILTVVVIASVMAVVITRLKPSPSAAARPGDADPQAAQPVPGSTPFDGKTS